jgi:NarL family two-component system response regulator LiaR
MKESGQIRIVVAEDHMIVRDALQLLLDDRPNMTVVGVAGDGAEALELVERLQPDVLIVDIRMPLVSGIEVARRTPGISPDTKTLAISAYDEDEYILALMEAGAAGYMLKTAAGTQLVDAVERIAGGESVLHPAIASKVARLWARRQVTERDRAAGLSERELRVLALASSGLRNGAIAEKLGISVRTVEGHLRSLYSKLGVSSRVEALLFAISRDLPTAVTGES